MNLFLIERMYGFPNSCNADFAASCLPSFFIPFVGVLLPALAIIVFAKFVETAEQLTHNCNNFNYEQNYSCNDNLKYIIISLTKPSFFLSLRLHRPFYLEHEVYGISSARDLLRLIPRCAAFHQFLCWSCLGRSTEERLVLFASGFWWTSRSLLRWSITCLSCPESILRI